MDPKLANLPQKPQSNGFTQIVSILIASYIIQVFGGTWLHQRYRMVACCGRNAQVRCAHMGVYRIQVFQNVHLGRGCCFVPGLWDPALDLCILGVRMFLAVIYINNGRNNVQSFVWPVELLAFNYPTLRTIHNVTVPFFNHGLYAWIRDRQIKQNMTYFDNLSIPTI